MTTVSNMRRTPVLMQACRGVVALAMISWGLAHAAPTIDQWTQAGGARVHLVALSTLPMVDIQIDFDGGSRRDPAEEAGLAAVTAMMLDKGVTATASERALNENELVEAWADLGAQWSAQATADRFSVRLRALSRPEVLQPAVALAARQLVNPAFPQAVWTRERDRLVAGWRQAQTQPDTLADRLFSSSVYGAHPYGIEPSPQTWAAIEVADLQRFHQRHLRACDARVTLVGDITREQARAVVNGLLGRLQTARCDALPTLPEVSALTTAKDIREPFAAAQAQILVGQPGFARSDPDFLVLTVANHILGGSGFTSRLMQEIREKRGLTYGIYSYFSPGRHAGAFTVSMQTRPDQAEEAVALIRDEIRRFVAQGPTDDELAQAKASLINGFALRLDSNRKLLDNVAAIAWNDLPLNYLDTWTAQVEAITREQVVSAVQRVLHPDRMVTVVLGGAPR